MSKLCYSKEDQETLPVYQSNSDNWLSESRDTTTNYSHNLNDNISRKD